ncbi:integron [Methylobacterium sp. CM6246]
MRTALAALGLVFAVGGAIGQPHLDVPIYAGGDNRFDACGGNGQVVGLDPNGDGFLSVRSGPGGRPFREVDRLYNGNLVAICTENGPWMGVVYGTRGTDCNVDTPWPVKQAYTGPCKAGWIHFRYLKVIAG